MAGKSLELDGCMYETGTGWRRPLHVVLVYNTSHQFRSVPSCDNLHWQSVRPAVSVVRFANVDEYADLLP